MPFCLCTYVRACAYVGEYVCTSIRVRVCVRIMHARTHHVLACVYAYAVHTSAPSRSPPTYARGCHSPAGPTTRVIQVGTRAGLDIQQRPESAKKYGNRQWTGALPLELGTQAMARVGTCTNLRTHTKTPRGEKMARAARRGAWATWGTRGDMVRGAGSAGTASWARESRGTRGDPTMEADDAGRASDGVAATAGAQVDVRVARACVLAVAPESSAPLAASPRVPRPLGSSMRRPRP
jgi:hypothetical protein